MSSPHPTLAAWHALVQRRDAAALDRLRPTT